MIGDAIGESPAAVRERIPLIFGVEEVLSPHYVVFIAAAGAAPATGKALAVGVAFTPALNPRDIGRQRQIDLTAAAVADAMAAADIADPADVHFVQIKGPAFPLADIAASVGSGAAQGLRRVLLRRQLLGGRRSQYKRGRRDWHERQVVGTLAVAHAPLADALDVLGIGCALRDLGFEAPGQLSADEAARLRQMRGLA
jgi:cyanuric acid amidohydrolase